jgi:hypothetical protein
MRSVEDSNEVERPEGCYRCCCAGLDAVASWLSEHLLKIQNEVRGRKEREGSESLQTRQNQTQNQRDHKQSHSLSRSTTDTDTLPCTKPKRNETEHRTSTSFLPPQVEPFLPQTA